MTHADSKRTSSTLGPHLRLGLVLALAVLLSGCGRYRLAKGESTERATTGDSSFAQEWLNAWSTLQNQPDVSGPTRAEELQQDPRETTSASGVVVAGERDPRPTLNHRSGSRLRVRTVLTDDGQQSWIGWHDAERGEDCEFQRDAEGALRCLPSRATRRVYFADEECTQRVAAVDEQQASSVDYALQRQGNQCTTGPRVYPLERVVVSPTAVFVQNHRGRCVSEEAPAATVFRSVGDEVPLTEFVAARQGIEGKAARVKAVGLVADDGAVSVNGFVDSELQTPCTWQGTHGTTCVPRTTKVSTFADETCEQPVLKADRNKCAPDVTFVSTLEADGCAIAYYQPGEAFQGGIVYEVTEQSYESREVPSEEAQAMQLGVRVHGEQLPTGKLERLPGATTRLSAQHWTTADGGVWFSSWYDNSLETECDFVQTSEDEWQCLPRNSGDHVLYADASCSQPITEVLAPQGCGEEPAPPRFVTEQVMEGGESVQQVRRVLGSRPYLATVYEQTETGCGGRAVSEGSRHFDVSQPLPTHSFARGLPITL